MKEEISLSAEDRILEKARRSIEAKKALMISAEMEVEVRRAVYKALRSKRKELAAVAIESVEEELKNESFRKSFKLAIARAIRRELRDDNLQNILPDLLPKVGEAMIAAIIK